MIRVDLDALESSVGAEYATLLSERLPGDPFCIANWFDGSGSADVAGSPQFPREQWVSVPRLRTTVLLIVRRAIELVRERPDGPESDALFQQAGLLYIYGGKVRTA
ncbi:Uncharacterised protein [Mycobacteroides abscessus subsp. abscessus]|uniref:Uncharacterized protein n=1 Tax=Mycobacteroides abscessus TaxID=36809 RepID=A0AB33T482_9MYCO|nr:Uncharacterised protein [Mycobacteroides abscessus]SIC67891.1 Uncharacterised protein [Mycobacteroides abscessus subsp. abscessus]CPT20923.1 Uncharacterised protein [Mycobacteroides abscessus]CPT25548.1 Uncharacterised protein [Mycobacteroides abscessus]CPU73467.1 Uncharacterised protein [Mycobacteroides abscessus]